MYLRYISRWISVFTIILFSACQEAVQPQAPSMKEEEPKTISLPTTETVSNGIFHAKGTALTTLDVIPSGNLPNNASKAITKLLQSTAVKRWTLQDFPQQMVAMLINGPGMEVTISFGRFSLTAMALIGL